jgi:integrase
VLDRGQVRSLLDEVHGLPGLVASLLYGAGLRLLEALSIRIKDLSYERDEIVVRSGMGGHDRIAILPSALKQPLRRQADRVRARHHEDLRRGAGWVDLPDALERKMPTSARDLNWQYLFSGQPPAHGCCVRSTPAPPSP